MTLSLIGNNLTCTRGDTVVFTSLDFSVEPGGALIVRGANGSGKSSLLRLAGGYLAPTEGELRRDGVLVSEEPERHLTRLHYVGHLDALKPAFTAAENLTFWSRLFSGEAVLRRLNLTCARSHGTLSVVRPAHTLPFGGSTAPFGPGPPSRHCETPLAARRADSLPRRCRKPDPG